MISCIVSGCIVLFVILFLKFKLKFDNFECAICGGSIAFGCFLAILIISSFMFRSFPSVIDEEKIEVFVIEDQMVYIDDDDKIIDVSKCAEIKIEDIKEPYVLKEICDGTYWLSGNKYTLVLPKDIM